MMLLYPEIAEADVIVFATPVYIVEVTGPTKNLLDRMLPSAHSFLELREGDCRRPVCRGAKSRKAKISLPSLQGHFCALMPREMYIQRVNQFFQQTLDALKSD